MISSPTVTVEDIDGCSSNMGRARLAEDFSGMHRPDHASRAGVRAREPREVALLAHLLRRRWADIAQDLLMHVNLRAPVLGRPLELC